ncbi:hypothetical protein [Lysobacter sp. M2-1]|uniref:hypothetical protein n=1 Tax=Lysobacter sp. M2-1 TaxID=2916839 RepID=UPI001F59272E|nr:hypothetical protein [Lysobacter sp. M2-1]
MIFELPAHCFERIVRRQVRIFVPSVRECDVTGLENATRHGQADADEIVIALAVAVFVAPDGHVASLEPRCEPRKPCGVALDVFAQCGRGRHALEGDRGFDGHEYVLADRDSSLKAPAIGTLIQIRPEPRPAAPARADHLILIKVRAAGGASLAMFRSNPCRNS